MSCSTTKTDAAASRGAASIENKDAEKPKFHSSACTSHFQAGNSACLEAFCNNEETWASLSLHRYVVLR